ncbi:MAG: helix-turn-helix domain-containing protein [Candidatus Omnitrophica bacterium]|nr:helix-turn-helix domain-containing protein [Candidatus Omnitrophota bacterium]
MSNTGQYISVRETAQILGVSEQKVMDLITERKLQAYKIADKFLRLNKNEVLSLRNTGGVENTNIHYEYTAAERIKDFFYFNDFYLFAAAVIFLLLYIIFYY